MTNNDVSLTAGHSAARPPVTAVRLRIAGLRIVLEFAEELGTGERVAELWGHLRDPDVPPDLAAAALAGADEPDITLRYARRGSSAAEHAIALDDQDGAPYKVSTDVTRAVIGKLRGTRILLHAGSVQHPRHGVIVLVGPSGAGKSTAITHLGRAGRYITDELAIIDPHSFCLSAYSKPVSRVDGGAQSGRKRDLSLASQGLDPIPTAPAPSLVLLLDRDRGESATTEREPAAGAPAGGPPGAVMTGSLERIPLREALPRIIEQSSSLWAVPGGLAALAELLTTTGGAVRVRYREAAVLETLLDDLPGPSNETWEAVDPKPGARAPGRGEAGVAPFVQAILLDGCVLVLASGSAATVEGLSALIWDELYRVGPTALDALEAAILDLLGPHPDSRALLVTAVRHLANLSLLQLG